MAGDRKRRNYKLVLDPNLKPGSQKVYRFDGSLPGVRVSSNSRSLEIVDKSLNVDN